MLQAITLSSTSQSGTTREVKAKVMGGKVVGTFRRVDLWGDKLVSRALPIRGDLEKLAAFATKQPGMFAKWVDSKFGIK
ncbi:MAG: hypothetical protein ABSD47_19930 [Candidatus Methylomirabilota bacterium]|jgi:hypothetical protein